MPDSDSPAASRSFAAKLGIGPSPGQSLVVLEPPADFLPLLDQGLVPGVTVSAALPEDGPCDVIVFWAWQREGLRERFERLRSRLKPGGALWAVIAKSGQAPAGAPDWRELQEAGLAAGLVDNKTLTFSEREYGTRFVLRLKDRPGG